MMLDLPVGEILLVEDDRQTRQLTARALTVGGWFVTEAGDGIEGFRALVNRGRPDVLVTDLAMPRMSGFDFAAAAREMYPDLPVLYVSGWAASESARPLHDGEAFLEKPFTPSALRQAVSLLTARRAAASA